MKNMKNIGRIVLPIIILLLTVRINAVPVKAFDMIVRNLPNSEQLPTKNCFVFSRIRKDICGMALKGEACAVMMDIR